MAFDDLSILLSCFNEEQSIERCLTELAAAVPGAEIVVIHGGRDRTLEVARRMAAANPLIRTYRNYGDSGKGHAIKLGISVTERPLICQFDADMQFDAADIPKIVEPLRQNEADLVIGSRFLPESTGDGCDVGPLRVLGNKVVNGWTTFLCRQPVSDVTTGQKAWTRAAIEQIRFTDNRFVYEMEIVVRAAKKGLRIKQVPITYHQRAGGVSGHGSGVRELWSITTCGLRILWGALLIRVGWW